MNLSKIISRYLLGSQSREEQDDLNQWMDESEVNREGVHNMKALWDQEVKQAVGAPEAFKSKLTYRLNQKVKLGRKRQLALTVWKVAAVFFMALTVGSFYVLFNQTAPTGGMAQIITTKGQRTKAILPDGTEVMVNANSKLAYNPYEWSANRLVSLTGEAFFEVVHQSDHPFVVDANGYQVKVLGTKFNVRSYSNESSIATTLTEGKVEIYIPKISARAVLEPGDQFIYNKRSGKTVQERIDPLISSGWKDGILKFENASFDEFVQRVENYYQIDIIYKANEFKDVHFTGTFDNIMISQVFEIVNITIPITFSVHDNQVEVQRRK